jgi:hypothetical protein
MPSVGSGVSPQRMTGAASQMSGGMAPDRMMNANGQQYPQGTQQGHADRMGLLGHFYGAFNDNLPPEERVGHWGSIAKYFPNLVPNEVRDQFQGTGR